MNLIGDCREEPQKLINMVLFGRSCPDQSYSNELDAFDIVKKKSTVVFVYTASVIG
jgi:hypothetical protein